MIELSKSLTDYLNNLKNIRKVSFTEEELRDVVGLSLSKEDIEYLRYFPNLEVLEFKGFPSITQNDLDEVAAYVPKLKELSLVSQSALITVNLEMFFFLERLSIVSNDNLTAIFNLEKLDKLIEVTIYDNKKLSINNLYDLISKLNTSYNLDLIYYYPLVNYYIDRDIDLGDLFYDKVSFIDCYGIRNVHVKVLKKEALISLLANINDIVSLYCYKNDEEFKKFNVLHKWMLDNIVYINEDVEENLEYYGVVDAFVFKKAGRLSYARVFQLLLLAAGIKAELVYSSSVTDLIGKYNGIDILPFEGEGDYAIVKCELDDKIYYTDIAWNKRTLENNCYNDLKILLVSKDELLTKHNIAGDGIVSKGSSINPKQIEEIMDEVNKTIQDVDYLFEETSISDGMVNNSAVMFAENNAEIEELKKRINEEEVGTELYNSLVEELISLEKMLSSYNKIINKYNDSQKNIITKYSDFILTNYLGFISLDRLDSGVLRKLELRKKYNVIATYLYDLLKIYLEINNIK